VTDAPQDPVELVRAGLEQIGPVSQGELAAYLAGQVDQATVEACLLELERAGRARFTGRRWNAVEPQPKAGPTFTVCFNYSDGASQMLSREVTAPWPTVPRVGDQVEMVPASEDQSGWHAEVSRVYFHLDGSIELHVGDYPHYPDRHEVLDELRAHGYRSPGE
jgi:hypothetical protein